jgi:hypothetical protein
MTTNNKRGNPWGYLTQPILSALDPNDVTVGDTLTVGGPASVGGQLTVGGAETIGGALTVGGAAIYSSGRLQKHSTVVVLNDLNVYTHLFSINSADAFLDITIVFGYHGTDSDIVRRYQIPHRGYNNNNGETMGWYKVAPVYSSGWGDPAHTHDIGLFFKYRFATWYIRDYALITTSLATATPYISSPFHIYLDYYNFIDPNNYADTTANSIAQYAQGDQVTDAAVKSAPYYRPSLRNNPRRMFLYYQSGGLTALSNNQWNLFNDGTGADTNGFAMRRNGYQLLQDAILERITLSYMDNTTNTNTYSMQVSVRPTHYNNGVTWYDDSAQDKSVTFTVTNQTPTNNYGHYFESDVLNSNYIFKAGQRICCFFMSTLTAGTGNQLLRDICVEFHFITLEV